MMQDQFYSKSLGTGAYNSIFMETSLKHAKLAMTLYSTLRGLFSLFFKEAISPELIDKKEQIAEGVKELDLFKSKKENIEKSFSLENIFDRFDEANVLAIHIREVFYSLLANHSADDQLEEIIYKSNKDSEYIKLIIGKILEINESYKDIIDNKMKNKLEAGDLSYRLLRKGFKNKNLAINIEEYFESSLISDAGSFIFNDIYLKLIKKELEELKLWTHYASLKILEKYLKDQDQNDDVVIKLKRLIDAGSTNQAIEIGAAIYNLDFNDLEKYKKLSDIYKSFGFSKSWWMHYI